MADYTDGMAVVKQAKRRLGAPYRYGAERAKGDNPKLPIDCSELVEMAFKETGLPMVDGARNQINACRSCSLTLASNVPGALVFWRKNALSPISHVGISTGQGNVIHASGGAGKVIVEKMSAFKWTHAGLPTIIYG